MDINFVDVKNYFQIADKLLKRGVRDTGTVINVETLKEGQYGQYQYRAWYWETEESEKIRLAKKKEANEKWKVLKGFI